MLIDANKKISEINIGTAGEHLVVADLLLKGVNAFITGHGLSYDVVAELDGKLIKIQVKTTKIKRLLKQRANPIYFFQIKRTGKHGIKRYDKNDFAIYALVALDIKQVFYLNFDNNIKTSSICVRDKNIDYSGHRGGGRPSNLYFQDLTWEKATDKKA